MSSRYLVYRYDISLRRQSPKNHRRLSARDFGVEEGLTERGYLDIVVKSFTDTSKNLHVQKKKSTFAAHFQTITAPLTLFHCSRVGGEKEDLE